MVLGTRLRNWDNNIAGQCYDTSLIAGSGAPHPLMDHVYLSITCFYMFVSIRTCWLCGEIQSPQPTENQNDIRADEGGRTNLQLWFDAMRRWDLPPASEITLQRYERMIQNLDACLQTCKEIWENRHKPFQWSLVKRLMKSIAEAGTFGETNLKSVVLGIAMVQFPVHTYMIFALRYSNEHRLSGDSENTWGFGQIVALVLLGSTLVQSMGTITSASYFFLCAARCFN